MRERHRSHPLLNFGYQEVFDAFGGRRNLGIVLNVFYSENAVGFHQADRDYQNTTVQPAYVWSYQTFDNYNNRKQSSVNAKLDYRLSANSKFSLNLIYNDAPEPMRRQYQTRAFAGSQTTVPNATTSGVVPGWTDRITTVRAVPQSPFNANGTVNTNTSGTTRCQ